MIYELRTYDLRHRSVPEFGRRTAEKLAGRLEYSSLGGFWHAEVGRPLNQVVHIWPYDDLSQRADIRARAVADGKWPPDNTEFILNMQSEILNPAPFMTPLGERKIGPLYELRTYTYSPDDLPRVIDAWAQVIEEREKLSPLAGCWYTEIGPLNRFVHLWAYNSYEERVRVRKEALDSGVWPPPTDAVALRQENKILTPFEFSPMQ